MNSRSWSVVRSAKSGMVRWMSASASLTLFARHVIRNGHCY